jgi:hypothetical protein
MGDLDTRVFQVDNGRTETTIVQRMAKRSGSGLGSAVMVRGKTR